MGSFEIFNFENLLVYKRSLDFIDEVYLLSKNFPKLEEYRLSNQLIRASHSIALNIAEGSAGSNAEFIYFLRVARRSTMECIVCLSIAKRQNYISTVIQNKMRGDAAEISKMIIGLVKSIKNIKDSPLPTHNAPPL